MMIPIDVHLYELWANSGENPWDLGELGTFTASVLLYGPAGCGKTYLAETFCAVSGREGRQLDAVKILKKPDINLRKQFDTAKSDRRSRLLVEGIDNLFTNLRVHPSAHRLLLERLKQPPFEMVIFATARRPDDLLADELDVFKYVLPVFYGDRSLREVTMIAHAGRIALGPCVDLREISDRTEWWAGQELEELITSSPLDRRGILTQEILLRRVEHIGSNIVAEHRRKRTQKLLEFTAKHCTSNYIREDIMGRFGTNLEVPETVPAPPSTILKIEEELAAAAIRSAMEVAEKDDAKVEERVSRAELIIEKIKMHRLATLAIVIGTITIAIGSFFGALTTIVEFFDRFADPKPTTVTELQNTVRTTALELKGSFNLVTSGRTPPIPDGDFDRVNRLITKIEQLSPGNGHVIYYRGFITRWRNQRLASHTDLFWYLERAKDPNLHMPGDNGDAKFCFDNWLGYCNQRQAFINHVLALDFEQVAREEKDPTVALARLRAALERAETAIKLYGEFNAPGQGTPTRTLAESLRKQISEEE